MQVRPVEILVIVVELDLTSFETQVIIVLMKLNLYVRKAIITAIEIHFS